MRIDEDGKFNLAVKIRDLENENATLRADVARLTEAIEWALDETGCHTWSEFYKQLEAHAFLPTESEYDEVTAWKCKRCSYLIDDVTLIVCPDCKTAAIPENFIKLKGIDRIPRKKKEKKSTLCFYNIVTGQMKYVIDTDSPEWVDAILTWEE